MSRYAQVPLGEICTLNPRARNVQCSDDTLVSFVPMAAVDERTGTITADIERPFAEIKRGYTSFENGDVLFAKITPCMENGKIALARDLTNGIGRGSTEFYVLRPSERVLGEYIYHFVRQLFFRKEAEHNFTGTAGQQRVPKSFMQNFLIPLPSLDEQQRIVGILNLATRIDHLRQQAQEHWREFMPALFVRMFCDPTADISGVRNGCGHPTMRLGDLATVAAGDPAPQDLEAFALNGPLFVRMQDVGRHHRHPALADSTDRLSAGEIARNRLRLFPKDSILIPKSGASVNLNHRAKLAIDAYVVSHLAVVIPDQTRIDPDYLFWWSVSYDPRSQAQVTSLPSLKLSTLKSAMVPLPPLDEQRRFAEITQAAQTVVQHTELAGRIAATLNMSLMHRLLGDWS